MTSSTWGRLQDQQGLLRTCVTCLNKQRGPSVPLVSPLPHPSFLPNPMLNTLIAGRWSRSPSKPSMTLLLVRAFLAAEAEHLFFSLYLKYFYFLYLTVYWLPNPKKNFFYIVWDNGYSNCKNPGTLRREGAAGGCLCQADLLGPLILMPVA